MTWVQVECSNGRRYSAPSHGRPPPNLLGAAQLFQPPLSLRQLRTCDATWLSGGSAFETALGEDTAAAGAAAVTVLMDQRDLASHMGITTVAVGSEDPFDAAEDSDVMAAPGEACQHNNTHNNKGDDDGAPAHCTPLHLLMERVYAILACTDEGGVALLLDALCTRAPPTATAAAAARARVVAEDDGGRGVLPALLQCRAQLPLTALSATTAGGGGGGDFRRTNQCFLQKLTRDSDADKENDVPPRGAMQLMPMGVVKAAVDAEVAATQSEPRPRPQLLTHEAAMRRQSLLYFVPHDVVPLSLLHTHVRSSSSPSTRKTTKDDDDEPTAAAVTAASATTVQGGDERSPAEMLQRIAQHIHGVGTLPMAAAAANTVPSLSPTCASPLSKAASAELLRDEEWAATAQAAQECGTLLLLTFCRLLVTQSLTPCDADQLNTLLLHSLWTSREDAAAAFPVASASAAAVADDSAAGSAAPQVPLLAAFSPSGLLLASAAFRACMSHGECMLLAAAAVDQLTRFSAQCAPPAEPGKHATWFARVVRWTSWPMRLGAASPSTPSASSTIVDVLLVTVGDALALCLCFPRSGATAASPAVNASLSLKAVQRLLERAMAKAEKKAALPSTERSSLSSASAAPQLLQLGETSFVRSLVFACTHSTEPHTAAFHDAVFVTTAVEEALMVLGNCEGEEDEADGGFRRVSTRSHAGTAGGNSAVMEELRRLVPAEKTAQRAGVAPASVVAASAQTVPPAAKPRTGLQKLLARLPFGKEEGKHRRDVHAQHAPGGMAGSQTGVVEPSERHTQLREDANKTSAHVSTRAKRDAVSRACAGAQVVMRLPLEVMLCYVAAVVTRSECGALRSLPSVGMHSFFFLQKSSPGHAALAAAERHDTKKSAVTAVPQLDAGSAGEQRSAALRGPPRFGLSFYRHVLQQANMPAAILSRALADADGSACDGGGSLTFLEDPTLSLPLALGTRARGSEWAAAAHHKHASSSFSSSSSARYSTSVTVLPTWSILQLTVAEPSTALVGRDSTRSSRHGDRNNDDDDEDERSAAECRADTAAAAMMGGFPPHLQEEAQLLTCLGYGTTAHWRHTHRKDRLTLRTADRSQGGGADPVTLSSAGQCGAATADLSTTPRSGRTSAAVAALINISGDLSGAKAAPLLLALQKRRPSAKSVAQRVAKAGGVVAADDSDPLTFEYASGTSEQEKKLCHAALLCHAASLALLEEAAAAASAQ